MMRMMKTLAEMLLLRNRDGVKDLKIATTTTDTEQKTGDGIVTINVVDGDRDQDRGREMQTEDAVGETTNARGRDHHQEGNGHPAESGRDTRIESGRDTTIERAGNPTTTDREAESEIEDEVDLARLTPDGVEMRIIDELTK